MGYRLRRDKEEMESQKCHLRQFIGDMRERLEHVVEYLHKAGVVQREQEIAEETHH